MRQPHKHRDVIIAWANGEDVEWYDPTTGKWQLVVTPNNGFVCWGLTNHQYRIKPRIVKREGWVNVYKYGPLRAAALSPAFHTKEEADQDAICDRVACIRIEWEEEV